MKTTIYSTFGFDKPYLQKAAGASHQLVFTPTSLDINTVKLAHGSQAVALFTSDNGNSEVIEQLHNIGVKYIALRSVGYDHIDIKKCNELGIKVANVPYYSPHAVAEMAVCLLLCAVRKIKASQNSIEKNDFRIDNLIGFDLNGKTIGIIGTGKIGSVFAKIMQGFGCNLIAYDILQNESLKNSGVNYVSLDELCQKSDIISLHCPLKQDTKYLLNQNIFAKMKTGVIIINTARGGVINTPALLSAIDSGIVGGAGLDVYENEKGLYFYDHSGKKLEDKLFERLKHNDKVILTAHHSFLTAEALDNIANTTIYNLDCWEKNINSKNEL